MFQLINEVGVRKLAIAAISELYRKLWVELIRGSYSQNYEDLIVEELFEKDYKGFYLEIGAYHPKRLSNTFRLYKRGWRGVVVEPNPDVKKLFQRFRSEDIYIDSGVGVSNSKMHYYKYLIPALNTFSEEQVKENKKKGFKVLERVEVNVIGIKDLLNKYLVGKHVDLLSLDVEGWDEEILRNWDWKIFPKVICVEFDEKRKISKFLSEKGYGEPVKTKYNLIFLRKD